MRSAFIALIILVVPFYAQAVTDNSVTNFTLDNGMEVVVIEDHRAPIVTHMVWYKVGGADEDPGQSGVAHFLEHLLFKGTETLKPGEFSEIVAANGGSGNAFTSFDYTGYFQRVAADRLPLMMQLEADRMQNLVLVDEEVNPEREVVIEERNSRIENNPNALFSEHRRALIYTNHPYGKPVIGYRHELDNLTTENALDFYDRYYAPNNAILVVAGDVTPDQVRALAQEHYGPLVPSDRLKDRVRAQDPPKRAPIRTVFADPRVRSPYVVRDYPAANRKSGDQKEAAALTMLAELLGGSGVTSVLGQKLQLEQKIAVASSAFYDGMSYDPLTFIVYAVPSAGVTLSEVEAAMDNAITEFLEEGVDEDHLARLKRQVEASEVYAMDDQSSRARRYGEALSSGLTVDDVRDWPLVLQEVTAEDIMDAARNLFDVNKSVTGWLVSDHKEAL